MRWFKPLGWIHLPVSAIGWLITSLALAFCAQVAWAVDHRSHSVTDTLYGIFPYVLPTLIVLEWLASKASAPSAPPAAPNA